MRHKYNVFYSIDRYDERCWWQDGKWKTFEELDRARSFCNGPFGIRTKKTAMRYFNVCPPGSRLTQHFYRNGKRYCNEWEMDRAHEQLHVEGKI